MKHIKLLLFVFIVFMADNLMAEIFLDTPLFTRDEIRTQHIKGSDRFVSSQSGLNLREDPFTKSKILISIPYYAKVKFLDNTDVFNSIGGKKGRWVKIKYKNYEGYVFDGFLKDIRMFIEGHGFWWGDIFASGEMQGSHSQCLYFGKEGDVYFFEYGITAFSMTGLLYFYCDLYLGKYAIELNSIKINFSMLKGYDDKTKEIKHYKKFTKSTTVFGGLFYATPKQTFFGLQSIHFCKQVLKKKIGLDHIWVRGKRNFRIKDRDNLPKVLKRLGMKF